MMPPQIRSRTLILALSLVIGSLLLVAVVASTFTSPQLEHISGPSLERPASIEKPTVQEVGVSMADRLLVEEQPTGQELVFAEGHVVAPLTLEVSLAKVVAGEKTPVVDASVHARLYSSTSDAHEQSTESRGSRTDEDGRVVLRFPIGGTVLVGAATADGYASMSVQHYSGGTHQLELLLDPAIRVFGRVTDVLTNQPIGGAEVTFDDLESLGLEPVSTDDQGRFELGPWKLGAERSIEVRADGYGSERTKLFVRDDGSWYLAPRFGQPPEQGTAEPAVALALVREKVITGRVVDAARNPIAGAQVEAMGLFLFMENTMMPDKSTCETDARGLFVLDGLRSDITHAVGVSARGYRTTVVLGTGSAIQDAGDILLEHETTLHGSIRDRWNQPIQGVRIELHQFAPTDRKPNLSPEGGANIDRDGWSLQGLFRWETFTDANGAFEFTGVPLGLVRVVAQPSHSVSFKKDIEITDMRTELESFVVEKELLKLHGRVSRRDEPISDARVEVSALSGPFLTFGATDAEGYFFVTGVQQGVSYVVRVYLPSAEAQKSLAYQDRVTFDGSPLEIKF